MKIRLGKSLFFAIVIAAMFFPAYSKIQELKQKDRDLSQKVKNLGAENKKLQEENTMLKNDPVYIEEVAREKLKVARENEIVFRVVDDNDTKE